MIDKYIRKQDVVDAVMHAWAKGIEPSQYIGSLEPADVAPVVHARWKVFPVDDYKGRRTGYFRIVCGCGYSKTVWHKDLFPCFCESCGAKMDGE